MSTTIIIHDDRVEILQEGYNIIRKTVYHEGLVDISKSLLKKLEEE